MSKKKYCYPAKQNSEYSCGIRSPIDTCLLLLELGEDLSLPAWLTLPCLAVFSSCLNLSTSVISSSHLSFSPWVIENKSKDIQQLIIKAEWKECMMQQPWN